MNLMLGKARRSGWVRKWKISSCQFQHTAVVTQSAIRLWTSLTRSSSRCSRKDIRSGWGSGIVREQLLLRLDGRGRRLFPAHGRWCRRLDVRHLRDGRRRRGRGRRRGPARVELPQPLRFHLVFDRPLEVVGGLAELRQHLAHALADLGKSSRSEHDEGHDEDEENLGSAECAKHKDPMLPRGSGCYTRPCPPPLAVRSWRPRSPPAPPWPEPRSRWSSSRARSGP